MSKNRYLIRRIKNLNFILKVQGDIFLFDIEETILRKNMYYEVLLPKHQMSYGDEFYNIFISICAHENLPNMYHDAIIAYGKHYKRDLMQPDIAELINELKNRGKRVYALTSGRDSIDKFLKLHKQHGISFDHVICTNRAPKGPALLRHIIEDKIIGTCVFIDNHQHKLDNVGITFVNNNLVRQLKLLHYVQVCRAIPNKESFTKYWIEVVREFKKNLSYMMPN